MKTAHKTAYFIIFIIISIIGFGYFYHKKPKAMFLDLKKDSFFRVRIKISHETERRVIYSFAGNSEAYKKITLKTEIGGKVNKKYAKIGDWVAKNSPVLILDKRELLAKYQSSKADLKQQSILLGANKKLYKKKLISSLEYKKTISDYNNSKAKYQIAGLNLRNSRIKAPFQGQVAKYYVENGEVVSPYQKIADFIDNSKLKVTSYVSEKLLAKLQELDRIIVIFANGMVLPGKLDFIAPSADNITHSYKMQIIVDNKNSYIKDGMSAKVKIMTKAKIVHIVKTSILTLDKRGNLGIKYLDRNNQVKFKKANIIYEDGKNSWLTNMPEQIRIITLGQGFVKIGQSVNIDEQ